MIYVISDLHGYDFETFISLLKKAGVNKKTDRLYILGDVIDRGKDGVKYLKWIMDNQDFVTFILGNHESMLLECDFLFDPTKKKTPNELYGCQLSSYRHWKANRANCTIEALNNNNDEENVSILEFLRKAPLYETIKLNNKKYLLSHSGGNFDKKIKDMTEYEWLWSRPVSIEDKCSGSFIRVFGHTPTPYIDNKALWLPIITDTWINVDCGCSFGKPPVLLRLDDLKTFTIQD